MAEVTGARRWLPRRRTDGGWGAAGPRAQGPSPCELRFLTPEPLYLKYPEMKRKVVNAGKLRLSPNEEAHVLKEDYERRRKLRLLQVREQERDIALQIREDIKQRRSQQLTRLAEELRTEWKESQTQKIKNLERLYLASLRTMGEGHQQAKENEPDLNALARRAAERKRKAEMRHKEALKLQKNKKEELMKQKTWHIAARKEALIVEKKRSAKITSLPPPPPSLFENIDLKTTSNVKTGSSTYHHLCTFVNREMDTKQPDPHLAAEEEAKRREEWQKQVAQERMEQHEKAHTRGFQAMKKIHLAQTQEKLMKELQRLQQEDLAHRRQNVAQMPPQLVELPYKRSEMKEDWQRELEFAFEDMYNADRMKGNLILRLEPEPLPTVTDQIQDEELDLSMEQEKLGETEIPLAVKTHQVPSKILFKKLLNKIRSQKSLWTIKSMSEDESEVTTTVSETESKAPTVESGATFGEERTLSSVQEQVAESDTLTVDSGPLTSEEKPLSMDTDSEREQVQPIPAVAQSSILLHPQEEAVRIRMAARQKQIMEIEEQKQKQLELLEQIEQQKLRLETDRFRAQLEEEKRRMQQTGVGYRKSHSYIDCRGIRTYEQFHRQSVETARKRLLEYQTMLKGKYPSVLATSSITDSLISVLPRKPERPTVTSEHWDQDQRPKLSPNKYQPIPSSQISELEPDYFQVPRQSLFPQRQAETTTDTLITSDVLAKQSLESQEQPKQSTVSVSHSVFSQMQDKSLPSSESIIAQQGNLKALQEQLDLQKEVLQSRLEAQEQLLLYKQKELEGQTGLSISLPVRSLDSFATLPSARAESGRIQASSPTWGDTAVPAGHLGVPQLPDRLLSFSQPVLSQQDNFTFLQGQLNTQRDSLQARREAQEVLHVHKQSELGRRIGSGQTEPPSLPSQVAQHLFTSLPSAGTHSGKIQEQYSSESEKGLLSSQSENQKSQDGSLSFLQHFLPLHDSLKLLQEQLTTQRDALQASHEPKTELLLHRQRDLGNGKSGQRSLLFSPVVAQRLVASQTPAKTEPRRIQNFYLSEKESVTPSSHPVTPAFQNVSHSFPQHNLPQQENLTLQEQSHMQRVMLGEQETQEFVHKQQHELEKIISPEQTGTSLSLSQVAESERCQEFMSVNSDGTVPLSHLKILRFQERLLGYSPHTRPLQDSLEGHQEWPDRVKAALHFSQNTQGNVSSEQTDSSFGPQLGQPSFTSFPSAESGTTQEPLSTESDSKSHLQIPQLQDRLLRLSQLIQPQQDNLKALGERLATQREAIIQSRQEAQEELLLHKRKEGISPEQVGTSSFLPSVVQHSFASLRLSESGRIQEPCSTKSDNTASSRHSEIPRLTDRGLSQPVLPQRDYLIALQQEHLDPKGNALPCGKNTQKELVLPSQYKFEEELPSEHFIQPHHDDLKVLQQQLEIQRKTIRSRQEVQEELIMQRLSQLEKRVSSAPTGSSSLSQVALPVADSERIQKPLTARSNNTVPSSHPETPISQDRLSSLSQTVLPQQDILTAQLDLQREVIQSNEKSGEELSDRQTQLTESESSEHAIPSLFLPMERDHSFIPLPFAEVKSKNNCELYSSKSEHAAPSSNSGIPKFQDRLLCLSQPVLTQQDNIELQKQLDLQKKVLQYSQKAQEELLVQRQAALQQQIQKHQQTLKEFFKSSQISKPKAENDTETQKLREWLPQLQDLAEGDQGSISPASRSNSGELLDKQLGRRSSKPPVAKVKCGLDLNQHELSAIPEVESPASGRTSVLGKPDFYQDRDPLRVSISREQSLFGSPLDCDAFGCLYPIAQENICGDDPNEAVRVKETVAENHAVLSYAVEEEHTYLSPAVKPDNAETEEIYHEPLLSITISTGSFLSYENTDLSLTDPVDLDFPELEHTFPNLHRQLFKPLEPHPDFDISSSYSGISQDSRDFYQNSDSSCESHHAVLSSKSTVSFTALRRTSLNSSNISLNQFHILQHADLPVIFSIEARDSSQSMENHYSEIMQNKKKSVHFQLSVGNVQNSVFSSSDEVNVFLPLSQQHSTPCGSTSSECSIKTQPEGRKERLDFEELSERGIDTMLESRGFSGNKNEPHEVLNIKSHVEEIDCPYRTVEMGTSVQAPYSIQNEKYFENSTKAETPKIKNLSQVAQSELALSSGSLQSSIPVWETESGHGIMEEPELTLVSTSDISIAEMDFANLTLEEKEGNEAKSNSQVNFRAPFNMNTPHLYKTPPNITALPGSLQEAFLKRKKPFMERSSQRQKEIKNKFRVSENSQIKTVKEKPIGMFHTTSISSHKRM
uniref:Centrosomal protein 295 n=1 Tax=Canis lupus dingo TaxID=286419 RepID=A0A8C0KRS2_CANLU